MINIQVKMSHACSGCIHPLKNQQKAAILFSVIANRKIVAFCTARIHDTLNYDLLTTLNKQLNGTDTSIFVYNICSDNFWSEKIEYTYHSNGKVEKAISYYANGDSTAEKHLWCTSIYEYDRYGNLTLFTFSDQNNVVQLCEFYKYEYDANGKMLIKWRGKGDSNEENRKYTEKYVYFY